MLKKIFLLSFALTLISSICLSQKLGGQLFPPIQPYETGYLKVSDIHRIFYQLGGNPEGKPIMVLHGGPGAGCDAGYFRYFNPEKFHIILHDQRGAGKSQPYAELKENTTMDLVEDIEKLRKHLGLGKVILFGGSWGSTLALAYAETYPENVDGMILRGIFTATKAEIDHFYHGGAGKFFPEVYEELASILDEPEKKNFPQQLLTKMQSPDSLTQDKYARAWARYEGKIAFLNMPDAQLEKILDRWPYLAFSVIENHYMAHGCFLEEGQLLNNTDKIAGIKTILINGRYDVICPPITAYQLHQKLKNSKLVIVERAGHSSSEPGIKKALLEAARTFE